MNMIAMAEVAVIKPPFKTTVLEIINWVKPVTVSVKGSGVIVGGLMIHNRALVTSHLVTDGVVKIQFPDDDRVVEAVASDYDGDYFLSYYGVAEEDALPGWTGLPPRRDPVEDGTYLFSFIHDHGKDLMVRFRAIRPDVSKAFTDRKDGEKISLDSWGRHETYPVVDRFGYLVGINIGACKGETLCQIITPKSKL